MLWRRPAAARVWRKAVLAYWLPRWLWRMGWGTARVWGARGGGRVGREAVLAYGLPRSVWKRVWWTARVWSAWRSAATTSSARRWVPRLQPPTRAGQTRTTTAR